MSEREEIEALVGIVRSLKDDLSRMVGIDYEDPCAVAAAVVSSDWLAAHDDRIRAEALEEAAGAWEGGPTGAAPIPQWWLTDRAAALRVAAGTPTREEEVGTGIGGGSDPAQTEATPWDNRSGDRPEDPPAPTSPSFQGGTDG